MVYAVATAFDQFRQNIELSGDHRDTAKSRRDRLVALLGKDFTIVDAFPTGSIPRFTAIREYADLDIMVVLHYSKHCKDKRPSQVLKEVQDSLAEYRTGVRRNGQAVTLYYETWPNVDIVPVFFTGQDAEHVEYYNVPDMNQELWLWSNPPKHDKDMTDSNKSSGDKFKHIVKMIKRWNRKHSDYLQSFHLEVMALHTFSSLIADYDQGVFQFFENACKLCSSALYHDGNQVDGYLGFAARQEALKRLATARDTAKAAWNCRYWQNDHREAIRLWKQVFGEDFPSYG